MIRKNRRSGLIVLCLIIAASLLILTIVRSRTSTSQARRMRAFSLVTQNRILLDSFDFISSGEPISAEEHTSLLSLLEQNVKDMTDIIPLLSDPNDSLLLQDVADSQTEALISYRKGLDAVKKAILYNPSEDLGGLSMDEDSERISTRASAAANGLKKAQEAYVQATSVSLATPTSESDRKRVLENLSRSADCFDQLSRLTTQNQRSQAEETRIKCIEAYRATRESMNEGLLTSYRTATVSDALTRASETFKKYQNE